MKIRDSFCLSRAIQEDRIWHYPLYVHVFVDICYRLNDNGIYEGKLLPLQYLGGDVFIYDHDKKQRQLFNKACNWLRKYGYITAIKVSKPYRVSEWIYKVELGDVGKQYVKLK